VHPLRRFLQHGMRVALTTNNRLFLDTTLSGEFRLATDEFDLTLLEVENLCLSAFKSAFLPQSERVELVRRAVAEFNRVRRRHHLEVAE
jgi:adenosine deaminase